MNRNSALVLGLLALQAMGAGLIAADPSTLGLPAVASAWVAIGMLGLNVIVATLKPLLSKGGT